MNSTIRLVTGILITLIGIGICIAAIFVSLFMLIYGIPWVIVGLAILFNKSEEKIEPRKDLNKS